MLTHGGGVIVMRTVILTVLGLALLAGCSRDDDRILFDGQAFRGKAKHIERDDRRSFTATVSPVSASVDGAREAGRFEGVKYCIQQYGTSRIAWATGPDDDPQTWSIDRDTVTFTGRCKP